MKSSVKYCGSNVDHQIIAPQWLPTISCLLCGTSMSRTNCSTENGTLAAFSLPFDRSTRTTSLEHQIICMGHPTSALNCGGLYLEKEVSIIYFVLKCFSKMFSLVHVKVLLWIWQLKYQKITFTVILSHSIPLSVNSGWSCLYISEMQNTTVENLDECVRLWNSQRIQSSLCPGPVPDEPNYFLQRLQVDCYCVMTSDGNINC